MFNSFSNGCSVLPSVFRCVKGVAYMSQENNKQLRIAETKILEHIYVPKYIFDVLSIITRTILSWEGSLSKKTASFILSEIATEHICIEMKLKFGEDPTLE